MDARDSNFELIFSKSQNYSSGRAWPRHPLSAGAPPEIRLAPQTANGRQTPGCDRSHMVSAVNADTAATRPPGSVHSRVLTLIPAMRPASPRGSPSSGEKNQRNTESRLSVLQRPCSGQPCRKEGISWGPSSMRGSDCRGDKKRWGV